MENTINLYSPFRQNNIHAVFETSAHPRKKTMTKLSMNISATDDLMLCVLAIAGKGVEGNPWKGGVVSPRNID